MHQPNNLFNYFLNFLLFFLGHELLMFIEAQAIWKDLFSSTIYPSLRNII